jgi:hypothetical protein
VRRLPMKWSAIAESLRKTKLVQQSLPLIFTVNSDYFLKQHYPTDLCNGEVLCSL